MREPAPSRPSGRKLVAVVGGGPAGLGAALELARAGLDVVVIEEEKRLGGQYFRGKPGVALDGSPAWYTPEKGSVEHRLETSVVDVYGRRVLLLWNEQVGLRDLEVDAVIVATGAYDRPVPTRGWTLPGVLTAGGGLVLAKAGGIAPGSRVIVAGAGPFVLAVASAFLERGSRVTVLDASPWRVSAAGAKVLVRDPALWRQTLGYVARLAKHGCRVRSGELVTAIGGVDRVEWADISPVDDEWRPLPGRSRRAHADIVAMGFGFVPRIEVARMLGCRVVADAQAMVLRVEVDQWQRTSVPGIYAAGEVTGLAGARIAAYQGRLAGLTAALDLAAVAPPSYAAHVAHLRSKAQPALRMARWLAQSIQPRRGLFELAADEDVVCRCEEVSRRQIDRSMAETTSVPISLRAVKAATRAGMGRCQGRMCYPTMLAYALARGPVSDAGDLPWTPRPPLRPVPLGAMAEWRCPPANVWESPTPAFDVWRGDDQSSDTGAG